MIYPRLAPQLDRRKKLMPEQIEEIRELAAGGKDAKSLAQDYNVSWQLIRYWTDSVYNQMIRDRARTKRNEKSDESRKRSDHYRYIINGEEHKKYMREWMRSKRELQKA